MPQHPGMLRDATADDIGDLYTLLSAGGESTKRRPGRSRNIRIKEQALRECLNDGLTMKQAAARLGCSDGTIYQRLSLDYPDLYDEWRQAARLRSTPTARRGTRVELDMPVVKALLASNMALPAVAELLKTNVRTLRRLLQDEGIIPKKTYKPRSH